MPPTPLSTADPSKATDRYGRTQCEPSFQPPLRTDIATVVFPGFLSSFGQASKYTGPDPIILLSQADPNKVVAEVRCKYSLRVLHNVLPASDVRENKDGWGLTPLGLFASVKTIAVRKYFRMPDLPMAHSVASLNNMAGYEDQADCTTRIEQAIASLDAKGSSQKLVLFGFSRGATTMMLTSLKLRPDLAARISLVILEAPFDTFDGVMKDSAWFPRINQAAFKCLGKLSDPQCYELPDITHLTCPIAFITSDADARVPKKTTLRCIANVKQLYPHLTVEHLELRYSKHPTMSCSNEVDRDEYILFMERLYDKYISKRPLTGEEVEEKIECKEDAEKKDTEETGLVELTELV